jgi:hypothetical protein
VTSRASLVAGFVLLGPLLAACTGDDDVVAPSGASTKRDASASDATLREDAPAKDAAYAPEAEAGPCTAARASDAGLELDADLDAGTAADGAACVPRVVTFVDFARAPRLTTGGPRPGAWEIGKASSLFGPAIDHAGRAGDCFLATRPGARYRLSEEAWAELDALDLRGVPAGCPITLSLWIWYELEVGLDAANVVAAVGDAGAFEELGVANGPSLYDQDDFQTSDCGGGDCQVFGQSVWSTFAPGSSSWRQARFDLGRFAGQDGLRLRFQFHSDGFANYQGIYLQDLAVTVP